MNKRKALNRTPRHERLPLYGTLGLFFGLTLTVSAHAAGDAKHGKVLAQGCVGCHGVEYYDNVYPTYHVPKLGGQSADYIVSALGEYKSGARKHESMQGNAESLSDQDMADIAAYFSSLTPSKAE